MPETLDVLTPDYIATLAAARVEPKFEHEIDEVARRLLTFLSRYEPVQKITGVPVVWLATVFEREASSNFNLYFGNGDPLNRHTTHVPAGRGPFFGPDAWVNGTLDAIRLDRITAMTTWPQFLFAGERWNGFGPRAHGKHTGYLWCGTTAYTGGKYVADGVWNPDYQDTQLGIVPVAWRMIELNPSLAFASDVPKIEAPSIIPAPIPHPVMASINPKWVQASLNRLRIWGTPLLVDGNVGRATRYVVEEFQRRNRLLVDGIPGPQVVAALKRVLAENGMG
jgi:lysozyme family protein